ncbi:interleukin-17 receptor B isoform X2 [Octodon degus]|uniref:Interleukin-17 receptor B n=1 Tax=Octodon degus TaxID=10160 RepID=A0A6P6EGJ4_OCTDE|nr:interleukin-17 receptor B isoform X2 [Octodon degus]
MVFQIAQTIQCGSENGPSPEWTVRHPLTPGDLRHLRVELAETNATRVDHLVLMNISWELRADASILSLKATKICVTGKSSFQSYSCVRCNYTEAFQRQTSPSGGKWTFSYVGFPVAPSTLYFIGAHNIPNANMNEDTPSLSVNLTSPGCQDPIMKHKKKCIEEGSLWDPHITACKKDEETVEVNFTTSPLGNRYLVVIQYGVVLGFSNVQENRPTRTSVVVQVKGQTEGATVQLIPYFQSCGNDCIRRRGTVELCLQTDSLNTGMVAAWLGLMFVMVLVWVLIGWLCGTWRCDRGQKAFPPATTLPPLIKVLVVSSPEVCFYHTVCYFIEFLQKHCRSEVILAQWQKKKIAEMGPVQWLTAQKKAADKVIFLLSNVGSAACDESCGQGKGSPRESSQDLFPLAFNLFCSDLSSQTHLHKYIVVYFRGVDPKDDYSALHICPKYHLMREATALCTALLCVTPRTSVEKQS